MPLRAAQLLVRSPTLASLGDLLERALRRQKPAPGAQRELLLLQAEEWGCVLEHGRVDGGLARLLSELSPGAVVALELEGSRCWSRWRQFEGGEAGPLRQEPREAGGSLPLVADVEQECWEALAALGVPAALRLLALEEVPLHAQSGFGVPALLLRPTAQGLSVASLSALPPERPDRAEAPVLPDSLVQGKTGETRALEVRLLPDVAPTREAAEALAAVEEQVSLRLCLQLAGALEEHRLPRPTFVYRTARGDELARLLVPARAERPWLARLLDPAVPPPLTHAGFTGQARALLAAVRPDARVLRVHGLWLELRHPGSADGAIRVDLEDRWRASLLGEEPEPDPDAPGDGGPLVAEVNRRLRAPLLPVPALPREAALAGLLPVLLPAADAAGRAALPFAGGLSAGLLCDAGGQLTPVDDAALAGLGLDAAAALERALDNADALTLAAPRGLLFFDLEHGRVAVTDFDDPAGSGRLASPAFRALLRQLLGPGCLAAAPTRDTLLGCGGGDPDALAWLRAEAAQRYAEGPFPIAPGVFEVGDEAIAPLADDGPGD